MNSPDPNAPDAAVETNPPSGTAPAETIAPASTESAQNALAPDAEIPLPLSEPAPSADTVAPPLLVVAEPTTSAIPAMPPPPSQSPIAAPTFVTTIEETSSPATPKPATTWLLIGASVACVLQLVLNIAAPRQRPGYDPNAVLVGVILGATFIWPAIVVGLFSIGKRFRNTRSRSIILMVVWGLFAMAPLQQIAARRRAAPMSADIREVIERLKLKGAPFSQPEPEAAIPMPSPTVSTTPSAAREPTTSAPEAPPAKPLAFDFSKGSDTRLIELIEHAQEARYHDVVANYEQACAARPTDAALALERVKFIEHFAYAEEVTIDSVSDDLEAAEKYLDEQFPEAPGTVLHRLENSWGDERETEALKYLGHLPRWPKADRARFWFLRAVASDGAGNAAQAERFAKNSFDLVPTVDAGLLLARKLQAANKKTESARVLTNWIFNTAESWEKIQQMNLLFDLGENHDAVALYERLKETLPSALDDADMATRLARAGRVDTARALFAELPVNDWNAENVGCQRFDFELQYGSGEQALAAYRALRETGLAADPFFRERARLFWKYPGLAWSPADAGGAAILGVTLLAALLSPLLLLIPVHYWSLLRARRGKTGGWPDAHWGLRDVWVAIAAMVAIDFLAIWFFHPAAMRSWFAGLTIRPAAETDVNFSAQVFVWTLSVIVLLGLLWRRSAWRILGGVRWGFWKSLGLGVGSAFALYFVLLVFMAIWPDTLPNELASFSPATRLCLDILKRYGALALIGLVAVFVPILEETLFRGVLLQGLSKHIPFGWANSVQALAFAAVHQNLVLAPFFFAFGVTCGVLARRSGGLLPSILLHGFNNLRVCLAILVLRKVGIV